LAYLKEQNDQNTLGAAYAPIHDLDLGVGGSGTGGSPYRPTAYTPSNVHTVTPVHHYSRPHGASGGYTSAATTSHTYERSYTGVSPDAYANTGPTTDQLLGTTKTSPYLSANKYDFASAYPTSTETKTYDVMEKVRRLGLDKEYTGDMSFLTRQHGAESPTVLSGGGGVNDIDLDELHYYSLANETKRTTTTTTTG